MINFRLKNNVKSLKKCGKNEKNVDKMRKVIIDSAENFSLLARFQERKLFFTAQTRTMQQKLHTMNTVGEIITASEVNAYTLIKINKLSTLNEFIAQHHK